MYFYNKHFLKSHSFPKIVTSKLMVLEKSESSPTEELATESAIRVLDSTIFCQWRHFCIIHILNEATSIDYIVSPFVYINVFMPYIQFARVLITPRNNLWNAQMFVKGVDKIENLLFNHVQGNIYSFPKPILK